MQATSLPPASGGVRQALGIAAERLAAVSGSPRLDAELLMAHVMGVPRDELLLRHLEAEVPGSFEALVLRRLAHEPIAYITGRRAFWTIDLSVGPGVLVPRPDSETLLEAAVKHFADRAPANVLDLGTGPGTLLLAALDQWPEARGVGVDRSPEALAYATANADRLHMGDRVRFVRGDWAEGIEAQFDLILCNPPYIATQEPLPADVAAYEPPAALFAGADGLDDYRRIVPGLPRLMAIGGVAVVEIGWTQGEAVSAIARDAGMRPQIRRDLGGRQRAVVLT